MWDTFQILAQSQSVHSNLADMLISSSDDEEETQGSDSNLVIRKTLTSEHKTEDRLA